MAEKKDDPEAPNPATRERWIYGLGAVLIGVVALTVAFMVAVVAGKGMSSQEALTALGVIASPIVAIVSAYFGIQATKQAADATVEAAKNAGEAETRAEKAETAAQNAEEALDSAEERGAEIAIKNLREPTIQRLRVRDRSDPTEVISEQAKGKAAADWDEILAAAGALDPLPEDEEPSRGESP